MQMQGRDILAAIGLVLLGAIALIIPRLPAAPDTNRPAYSLSIPAQEEIRQVEARINRTEFESLERLRPGLANPAEEVMLLGKLILYDENLSVNRNEACAFCHMPETGFTGPVSALNATTVSYPGSVRTRFSNRRPQTHTYATFTPVLHYNASQGDFVGGAFWDMRATGIRLNSPIAEQAQGPPLNPVEMGLSDSTCMVFRVSRSRYRALAEKVWGPQAFAIHWPENVERVCSQPGPAPASDPQPVHLSPVDRGLSNTTFDQIAQAIATYEASPDVNSFTSKYDFVTAKRAQFTAAEKMGYELFRSSATHCNECHRDGGPGEEPLFTDFTASNLGLPANPAVPFYLETSRDKSGYAANPAGATYIDGGVGDFLIRAPQLSGELNPNAQWTSMAPSFEGKFKVPTLRNVDKRPRPDFVKAYMHNGYLKSLKEIVHFYNTRDSLPRCQPGDPGEKVSCWPAPEYPKTVNKRQLGNLGLTSEQEDQIVAFLRTLSDGFDPRTGK
jgi:cytochrome c peroxidase